MSNKAVLVRKVLVSYTNVLGEEREGVSVRVTRCTSSEPFQVDVTVMIDPVVCRSVEVRHMTSDDQAT